MKLCDLVRGTGWFYTRYADELNVFRLPKAEGSSARSEQIDQRGRIWHIRGEIKNPRKGPKANGHWNRCQRQALPKQGEKKYGSSHEASSADRTSTRSRNESRTWLDQFC